MGVVVLKRLMLITLVTIFCMCTALQSNRAAAEPPQWTQHRMIAHAMGGISGAEYTNSYEAFVVNYEKGHRVFEVDLILTGDGKLAARHDWLPYTADLLKQSLPEDRIGESLNLREFKSAQILEKYKPLSFRDVAKLMQQYPDIYIVTDTKETDVALVRKQFEYIRQIANEVEPSILERLIPEIYTPQMYDAVMEIYAFPNLLYSLYLSDEPVAQTVQFVTDHQIRTVAMPVERVSLIPELASALHKAGVKIYTHTVNSQEEIQTLSEKGVYGVYTDFLPNRSRYFTGAVQALSSIESETSEFADFWKDSRMFIMVFLLMLAFFMYRNRQMERLH
ncbi:phosphatidylinositol-specific phospholipase C/glycerophosphodiester phosphodiesterase family protein [Paenibacillus silviterrae]|uniref:phosphatidylinositol-specific phospholipase C/glycerophosphodiester phosphodiesterase family protein n=1 Tax=Paenibacillus silviterrae TaxID=3242194 RepID=UPI0025437C01|nr:phosphatidylinositol-specific phospholipase C/glycerophosphodiester phosphodiesterase family protein [Paenibacillus chinjuensis]